MQYYRIVAGEVKKVTVTSSFSEQIILRGFSLNQTYQLPLGHPEVRTVEELRLAVATAGRIFEPRRIKTVVSSPNNLFDGTPH